MATPRVCFLMSDYGHDPTETAIPFSAFKEAGFNIHIVTENGKTPECDKKMLTGLTQKLLGANAETIKKYKQMMESEECKSPLSWSSADFSLDAYDLVFLPGGHEKSVRQQIDSEKVQKQLAAYFPQTKKPSTKHVAAICHGVLAVSEAKDTSGNSVLYECETTALPGFMEGFAYNATRLFLGDYYKTYGAGTDNVEKVVRSRLKDDKRQYKNSLGGSPFVVADKNYNYVSGRFPPDAGLLAKSVIELVQANLAQEASVP